MDIDLKNTLYKQVDALAPEYGLMDLTFPSFIRKAGYRSDISSSDAVEGLGALLEVATGIRLDFGSGTDNLVGGNGGREEWKAEGMGRWVDGGAEGGAAGNDNRKPAEDGGAAEEEDAEVAKKERQELDWGTRNFWLAWDALNTESVDSLLVSNRC